MELSTDLLLDAEVLILFLTEVVRTTCFFTSYLFYSCFELALLFALELFFGGALLVGIDPPGGLPTGFVFYYLFMFLAEFIFWMCSLDDY